MFVTLVFLDVSDKDDGDEIFLEAHNDNPICTILTNPSQNELRITWLRSLPNNLNACK